MSEFTLHYQNRSKKDQSKRDKIQLLFASFSLAIGTVDTFQMYSGVWILIPIVSFAVAAMNLFIVIRFRWFEQKYGSRFEAAVFRFNGVLLLLTALGFQFAGKNAVQYVYYGLAIAYFVLIPRILTAAREKMILSIDEDKIVVCRSVRQPQQYSWSDVESIILMNELIQVKWKQKKRRKKYFLVFDSNEQQSGLTALIHQNQKQYHFSIEER